MNLTSEFAKRKNDRQSSFRQKFCVSKGKMWPNTKSTILEYIIFYIIRAANRVLHPFQIIRIFWLFYIHVFCHYV
jgi:hypothetical protein